MKKGLIFLGGFVAGILATILVAYFITIANKPNDGGLVGLTLFPEKGECITTTLKNKSCEIKIFQVLAPNAALGNIKYYTDEKRFGGKTYRNYDILNDVVVLLINYDNKTYYDDQKIDISNKCARQIGTYQYTTKSEFEKTVPAIVIE
ncbi:hypothetical protein SDC9_49819 [bioreactor metagenome]|uniref:Uncharacterized protein n=1 Tax=bioreactor metagenome TaxID=1076179 RepID=A0A644WIG0_9ZZZZ|nr:hypothetical protein [Paludibacter sp.]